MLNMKNLSKNNIQLLAGIGVLISLSGTVQGAVAINFESPTYSVGALAGAVTSPAPFDGQGGWSRGVSSGTGGIVTTSTSGAYTGGQGLRSSPSANDSYIGGITVGLSGVTSISYDYQISNVGRSYLGLWNDMDSDGELTSGEVGVVFGASNYDFMFRIGNGGTESKTGVLGTIGNWYRLTMDIGPSSGGNRTVTLSVYNLTTQALVDLAPLSAATTFSQTYTDAQFGAAPEDADGLWLRLGSNADGGVIDNISAVPEPSFPGLAALGLCLWVRSRKRTGG
jgi:hypothetical protein